MSTRARATSMRAIRHDQQRTQLARILQWLYGAGEQGIAVPDLTPGNGFLFQDSAGTTPVTAYEQPVGRILDRSGRGNHLIQATSTKRPTLSARYNLLQRTEEFDNAAWSKTNATVSTNVASDPNGNQTADKLVPTTTNASHLVSLDGGSFVGANAPVTFSVYAKKDGYDFCTLIFANGFGARGARTFNLNTGAITNPYDVLITVTDASAVNVGNGWWRLSITAFVSSNNIRFAWIAAAVDAVNNHTNSGQNFAGDGTSGILLWGADLRLTIDTIGQPAYQRVGASNDYDTAGFFPYLSFDGTNYSMATAASVDFTGTNKMTVFAGVTKLSDAATGQLFELSTSAATNNGSFLATAPNGAAANYGFSSRGTSTTSSNPTTYASPISNVLTNTSDISAPSLVFRINGAEVGSSTFMQGTGNYGNYQLFLGARDNTSRFFNGRMYPFFIRGAATDAGLIAQVERYIKGRMPVNF